MGHGDPHRHRHRHRHRHPMHLEVLLRSVSGKVFTLQYSGSSRTRRLRFLSPISKIIEPALGHDLATRPPFCCRSECCDQAEERYRMDNMNPAVSSSSSFFSVTHVHSHPSLLPPIDRRRNDVQQYTSLPRDTQVPPPSPFPFRLPLSPPLLLPSQ